MTGAAEQKSKQRKAPPSLVARLAVNVPFTVVLFALALFQFGAIQTIRVGTVNMVPTLELEDRVVVRALGREPVLGDVIVYRSPFDPDHLQLGRIVGVAGAKVELGEKGLSVDGRLMAAELPSGCESAGCTAYSDDCRLTACAGEGCRGVECLIGVESFGDRRVFTRRATGMPGLLFPAVTVPEEHFFVLSDNRVDERDSRIYGAIPHHAVVGVLSFVYYAFDETGIRWDRISRPVS